MFLDSYTLHVCWMNATWLNGMNAIQHDCKALITRTYHTPPTCRFVPYSKSGGGASRAGYYKESEYEGDGVPLHSSKDRPLSAMEVAAAAGERRCVHVC